MATIRVRTNPLNPRECAVLVDPDDPTQPWWRMGGDCVGWEHPRQVEHWPEHELTVPPQ